MHIGRMRYCGFLAAFWSADGQVIYDALLASIAIGLLSLRGNSVEADYRCPFRLPNVSLSAILASASADSCGPCHRKSARGPLGT